MKNSPKHYTSEYVHMRRHSNTKSGRGIVRETPTTSNTDVKTDSPSDEENLWSAAHRKVLSRR